MLPSYKQPQGELACLRWQEGVNTSLMGCNLSGKREISLLRELLELPKEVHGGGHGFGVSDESRLP